MAQGTFVQALRKEAALSGTFMKGRSLMLNGAVLSIEDSGSRFSKNVTVEGSVPVSYTHLTLPTNSRV